MQKKMSAAISPQPASANMEFWILSKYYLILAVAPEQNFKIVYF